MSDLTFTRGAGARDPDLRPLGPTQVRVLTVLLPRRHSRKTPRLSISEIAEKAELTLGQATGAVNRCWERSLVVAKERERDIGPPIFVYEIHDRGRKALADAPRNRR